MIIKSIKGAFLVEATSEDLLFDGVLIKRSPTPFTIPEPKSIQKTLTKTTTVSYGDLPIEEYKNTERDFLSKAIDFRNITPIFSTIEEKDNFNKFIEAHPPKYETISYLQDVPFEIQYFAETSSPHIVPLRMIGECKPLFRYYTPFGNIITEIARKYGFTQGEKGPMTYNFSFGTDRSRPTLKSYSKINEAYLGIDIKGNSLTGTLEECEKALKADVQTVLDLFLVEMAKINNTAIPNLGSTISVLQSVLGNLSKITAIKSSSSLLNNTFVTLKDHISLLKTQLPYE
jgi:hypothetical protein